MKRSDFHHHRENGRSTFYFPNFWPEDQMNKIMNAFADRSLGKVEREKIIFKIKSQIRNVTPQAQSKYIRPAKKAYKIIQEKQPQPQPQASYKQTSVNTALPKKSVHISPPINSSPVQGRKFLDQGTQCCPSESPLNTNQLFYPQYPHQTQFRETQQSYQSNQPLAGIQSLLELISGALSGHNSSYGYANSNSRYGAPRNNNFYNNQSN
jgi:hypothetical protein